MALYQIGYIDADNPSGVDVYSLSTPGATFTLSQADFKTLTIDDDDGFLNPNGADATPGTAVGDPEASGTGGFEDGEPVQYHARYDVTGDDGSTGTIYLMSNQSGSGTQGLTADFEMQPGVEYTVGPQLSNVSLDYGTLMPPPEFVDGAETAETMGLGYTDADGDAITDGDDVILGNGGDDTIEAGYGSDSVMGGAGNDSITGDPDATPLEVVPDPVSAGGVTRAFSLYSLQDLNLSTPDPGGNTTTTDADLNPIRAFVEDDDDILEDQPGGYGQNDPGLQQTLLNDLVDEGTTFASAGDNIYALGEGTYTNLTTGETGTYMLIAPNSNPSSGYGYATTTTINPGDQISWDSINYNQNQQYFYDLDQYVHGFPANASFDDTLDGGAGNDTIDGALGDDVIFGGDDADTLSGGDGHDLIIGDNATLEATTTEIEVTDSGTGTQTDLSNSYQTGTSGTLTDGNGDSYGWQVTDRTGYTSDATFNGVSGGWMQGTTGDSMSLSFDQPLAGLVMNVAGNTVGGGNLLEITIDGTVVDLNDLVASGEAVLTGAASVSPDGRLDIGIGEVGGIEFLTPINDITVQNASATSNSSDYALVDFAVDDGVTTAEIPSEFNVTGLSGSGADLIEGGAGDDTIYGGDGADTIDGGADADSVEGGGGNDSIDGDVGNDIVQGGEGDDTLTGGDGADVLIGDSATVETTTAGLEVTDSGGGTQTDLSNSYQTGTTGTLTDGNGDTYGWEVIDRSGFTSDSTYNGVSGGWMQGITGDSMSLSFDQPLAGLVMNVASNYTGGGSELQITIDGVVVDLNDLIASGEAVLTGSATVSAGGGLQIGINQVGGIEFLTPINYITVQNASPTGNTNDYALVDFAVDDGVTTTEIQGDATVTDQSGTGDDLIDGGAGEDTIVAGDGNDSVDGGADADSIFGGSGDDTITGGDESSETITTPGTPGTFTATQNVTFGASFTNQAGDTVTQTVESSGFALDTNSYAGVSGYWVGNGSYDETHTHTFSQEVAGVQIRFNATDTDETWYVELDGVRIDLNQAIADGDVILTNYAISADGGVIGTGDATTPGFLNIKIPFTSIGIANPSAAGNGTIYELYVYTDEPGTPETTETIGDGDTIYGGDGDDVIDGGAGNDSLTGGDGDDVFVLNDNFDNDTIIGSETGETTGDTLDTSGLSAGVDITATGFEAGILSQGDNTVDYVEIEEFVLTEFDDTADFSADGSGVNIDGLGGDDTLTGGAGDDTVIGGTGDDTLTGGAGEDIFEFADGSGLDVVTDFDIGDTDSDGFFNDQFDVSGLTDAQGDPVNAWDVVLTDDGNGNTVLTFPNGERITMNNVDAAATGLTPAQFLNAAGIPCFTDGTLIRTNRGEVAIEVLQVGDLVETMDNGWQPIRWIGQRSLSASDLLAHPQHKPICIPQGTLGNYAPLFVSPLHGMLVEGQLARAKHLAEAKGPVRIAHGKRRVTYYHLLFDAHQVIYANGAASESFYPGAFALEMFPSETLGEIKKAVPSLGAPSALETYGPTARPFMKRKDVLASLDKGRSKPSEEIAFPPQPQVLTMAN